MPSRNWTTNKPCQPTSGEVLYKQAGEPANTKGAAAYEVSV